MDISVSNVANVVALQKRSEHTDKPIPEQSGSRQSSFAQSTPSTAFDRLNKSSNDSNDGHKDQQNKMRDQVDQAVKNINDFFQMSRRTMQFSVSENTGKMVIEIKDETTGELIRQIPSEEILQLEKKLDEVQGLLFSRKA
ncbi:flagellar protein FlaG [Methylocucumis oryzae]|nr:flagellar protein FlaG [Methylocucumis oryzae]